MAENLPDPQLVKAFGRAVRRHFEAEIAREREEAELRRTRVLPLVRQAIGHAREEGACGRAWLFGSYAWGEPGERSDVDILVDGCSNPDLLATRVGCACGCGVLVFDWDHAPESLRERVVATGLVL